MIVPHQDEADQSFQDQVRNISYKHIVINSEENILRLPNFIDDQQHLMAENQAIVMSKIDSTEAIPSDFLKSNIYADRYESCEATICTICLDEIANKSFIAMTNCKHLFHAKCLNEWIAKRGENSICPNCNSKLKK